MFLFLSHAFFKKDSLKPTNYNKRPILCNFYGEKHFDQVQEINYSVTRKYRGIYKKKKKKKKGMDAYKARFACLSNRIDPVCSLLLLRSVWLQSRFQIFIHTFPFFTLIICSTMTFSWHFLKTFTRSIWRKVAYTNDLEKKIGILLLGLWYQGANIMAIRLVKIYESPSGEWWGRAD